MRILWLKTDLLLPLDKGGKLRTWHLMRHLARRLTSMTPLTGVANVEERWLAVAPPFQVEMAVAVRVARPLGARR